MPNINTAEVHFHQQEQLSVYIQSTVSDIEERVGAIGLASFYAARMLVNLGRDQTSYNLGKLLKDIHPAVPLFATGESTGGFSLIGYPGHPGRHYFLASLSWSGTNPRFDFKPKGFGFFGKGMGYYGPVSVIGLVRFLAAKYKSDVAFHDAIGNAMATIGTYFCNGQLGMANQNQVALTAMGLAASILQATDGTQTLAKPAKRDGWPSGYVEINLPELKARLASLMPCEGRHVDVLTNVLGDAKDEYNGSVAGWYFLLPSGSASIHFYLNDKKIVTGYGHTEGPIENELAEMMNTVSEQRYRERLGEDGLERFYTLYNYNEMLGFKNEPETHPLYAHYQGSIRELEKEIAKWPDGEYEAMKTAFGSWLERI